MKAIPPLPQNKTCVQFCQSFLRVFVFLKASLGSFCSMQVLVQAEMGLLRAVSLPHLPCIPLSFIELPGIGVPLEYCAHGHGECYPWLGYKGTAQTHKLHFLSCSGVCSSVLQDFTYKKKFKEKISKNFKMLTARHQTMHTALLSYGP